MCRVKLSISKAVDAKTILTNISTTTLSLCPSCGALFLSFSSFVPTKLVRSPLALKPQTFYQHVYTLTYIYVACKYGYIYPIYPYIYLCTECLTKIQLQFAAHNAPNLISLHIPSAL